MRLIKLSLLYSERTGNGHGRAATGIRTSCIRSLRRIFRAQCSQFGMATVRPIGSNTSFDKSARHFQYVYVIPEAMVVLIDVRFSEVDAANTKVNVAYQRTALDADANEHVQELGNEDRQSGKEWGTAINDYLAKQKIEN